MAEAEMRRRRVENQKLRGRESKKEEGAKIAEKNRARRGSERKRLKPVRSLGGI
jgi:hypothetical protein